MVSQSEIAKALGVTQPHVNKLHKQRGMPITSVKAALEWRKKNPVQRAPTNGMRKLEPPKQARLKNRKRAALPKNAEPLWVALIASRLAQEGAFEMLQDAMAANRVFEINPLIAAHNKALEARLDAEKAYREELERRKLLVPKIEMIEMGRRIMESVLRRLRRVGSEVGPKVAQRDALQATAILESEMTAIIRLGEETINGL